MQTKTVIYLLKYMNLNFRNKNLHEELDKLKMFKIGNVLGSNESIFFAQTFVPQHQPVYGNKTIFFLKIT